MSASGIGQRDLARTIAAGRNLLVIDVRRRSDYDADSVMIHAAERREPDQVEVWGRTLPRDRTVVVYCLHGRQVSQGTVARLRELGFDALYLVGGIEGWKTAGGAVVPKPEAQP